MSEAEASPGRIIAIGDIHGCSAALQALLSATQPGPDDHLIVMGDVIDYGPDSREVLEQLRALRDRTPFTLLTGNHEELLFAVLDQNRDPESWTRHGGDRTLASYGVDHPGRLPDEDVALLRAARWFHETDTHILVHANYYPNQPMRDTPASALFWDFLDPDRVWPHFSGKTVVVGHTPQTTGEILDLGFVVGIDTDCSRGNWLTALDTVSGHYWQASQSGEVREARRRRGPSCR